MPGRRRQRQPDRWVPETLAVAPGPAAAFSGSGCRWRDDPVDLTHAESYNRRSHVYIKVFHGIC